MENREKAPGAPLVLIANDQEWSARSLESILGPNGYSVVRAYTGQQALDRARASQPDLIILDAQMPDMHGFDVCRTLRADPRFSATTPIVITTSGPSGRTQRLEAYRAGAWEFLGQPLDGESLLLKLSTFLQCKRAVDGLREENLLDRHRAVQHARALAPRERDRLGRASPARSARLRGVRARGESGSPEPPRTRWRSCPTRSRSCSVRRGVPPTPSAGWANGVRRDRAGHRPRCRTAPGAAAERRHRRLARRPSRWRAPSGSGLDTVRCPISPSHRWTRSSCSFGPRPPLET